MDAATQTQSRTVWDIFIRLFHWGLAGTVIFAWWSAEQGGNWMEAHMIAGYAVLALITFRLIWGFIGSPYARFSDFIKSPAQTLSYSKAFLRRQEPHYTGHNPLGGWMVISLIVLCTLQAGSGLFASDDIFTEGPLASLVSSDVSSAITGFHKAGFNILMIAVFLHLAGVIYHQGIKREPLIQGMIHGRKPIVDRYAGAPSALTLGLVAVAAAIGVFIVLMLL